MFEFLGYVLLAIVSTVVLAVVVPAVRWQMQKAAAERRHRALVAQGYVVVTMPISGERLLHTFSLDLTESLYVHQSAVAPFTAARAQGLEECNRIMATVWNRFVAGEIPDRVYVEHCRLYIATYARRGEELERQAVAAGLEQRLARAVRRGYYDYDFPDPQLEVLKLGLTIRMAASDIGAGDRFHRQSERADRPMKDVTPPRSQIGNRRLH